MNAKQTFENMRDDISGVVRCPQCQTAFKTLKECEVIDGFIYCSRCEYVIAIGD